MCVLQVRLDHRAVPDLRFSHGLEVLRCEKGSESSAILGSDSLGALTHNPSQRGGCGRLTSALPVNLALHNTHRENHITSTVLHHTPRSERLTEGQDGDIKKKNLWTLKEEKVDEGERKEMTLALREFITIRASHSSILIIRFCLVDINNL